MKKLIAILLVISVMLGLAACGGAANKLDIGIVLPTKDEDHWLADEATFKQMIAGEDVATTETINNEKIDIPVVRCDVQPITRDNLVQVWLDTGVYDKNNYTNYEGISDAVKPANYNN